MTETHRVAAPPQPWARGLGVALYPLDAADLEDAAVEQALRDGIERGYTGELPQLAPGSERFVIRKGAAVVGVLTFVRDEPVGAASTFRIVAIKPDERANAYGARALLAAERRLRRDGMRAFYSRVPRTNGRGLYFMLRCGYAPISAPVADGATWFRRNLKPPGRSAAGRARGPRVPRPSPPSARESSAGR